MVNVTRKYVLHDSYLSVILYRHVELFPFENRRSNNVEANCEKSDP